MSSPATRRAARSPKNPAPGQGRGAAANGAGLSLRERKKVRTRQAIRESAYRLIAEQGYDSTTVEQIAEGAEVSPSTVFRYFATKEDIVLMADALELDQVLRERPAAEPPIVSLREAIIGSMRMLSQEITDELLLRRLQLIGQVPALRAQMHEGMDHNVDRLCRALSERTGRSEDDLELRVVVGAMVGALAQVMLDWVNRGQEGDLLETVERALAVLERGMTL
ncbi:TetR family transcriptional regulator [Streptomyces sp. DG2A-72]|uniref:TetR/AcrR family transcriptional regulator n=1 Tax=Streptomyces sp. DG2A-72 TaxID=3051386 RepID=UPI00265C5034|nr:TetR family transcriptional regulator [Streptomyces sp. DG2A-72]MDO0939419.1 TetR family transcriptional regulator [Streptomyces sp. DG2A-72]